MSYEAENEHQDGAEGGEGAENADDLTMALAGGETHFVGETKAPMSKGTMVVAGLLIACGAVTYFMYVRTGPAEAVANAEQAQAEQIVSGFLSGPNKAREWADLIKSTDKVVQQFKREIPQVAKLPGNPFEKEKPKPDEDVEAIKKAQALEKARTALKESVSELKLQTIIHRDPKKASCMINNAMYRKGNKITVGEGKITFTIDDIRPDAVTVSSAVGEESLKFELKMKR